MVKLRSLVVALSGVVGSRAHSLVSSHGASLAALLAASITLTGGDAAAQPIYDANRNASQEASDSPRLSRVDGLILLDYQVISLPQSGSIDLMGLHVLNKVVDGLYLGIGAYAPLVKGEYGGFMAFDVTAHARRRVWGNLFADASVSLGGGGGGNSVQQSVALSGTGGFVKGAFGLGYDFTDFAIGANVARMKFKGSAIDSTGLNVFVQVPFSYATGPYANAGSRVSVAENRSLFDDSAESSLTVGLVNVAQIRPGGSYTSSFQMADFQFAHFMTKDAYWYASLGVGYQGLPLYNQLIGGVGYRFRLGARTSLHAQFGVGSGGYAPEKIDTGAGLLLYPKLAAEYDIARNVSLSLTAGYLSAAKGSSRNYTLGASLSYRIQPNPLGSVVDASFGETYLKGYRLSLFQQTEFNVSYRDIDRRTVNMLSLQLDSLVSRHFYIPLQASIAYVPYLGYPGYGEILGGIGVQTGHDKQQRLQWFGQVLGGANVHGPILKAGLGFNYGLSDRLALHASVGKTRGPASNGRNFETDYAGLGLTYRFSVPGR